jgi:hypothetical protein
MEATAAPDYRRPLRLSRFAPAEARRAGVMVSPAGRGVCGWFDLNLPRSGDEGEDYREQVCAARALGASQSQRRNASSTLAVTQTQLGAGYGHIAWARTVSTAPEELPRLVRRRVLSKLTEHA